MRLLILCSLIFAVILILRRGKNAPPLGIKHSMKKAYSQCGATRGHYRDMEKSVRLFTRSPNVPWILLVEIGDTYARGFYPYLKPDISMSELLYETAIKSPDHVVSAMALSKISETNRPGEDDIRGKSMRKDFGNRMIKFAKEAIEESKEPKEPKEPKEAKENLDREVSNSAKRRATNVIDIDINNNNRVRNDRIGGGSQNTHDHGVTSATKSNIKKLKAEFTAAGKGFRPEDDVRKESIDLCKKHLKGDDLVNSHHVIVSLSPDEYSGSGVSQIGILDLVLWKISTLPEDIRDNVRETLCKRLSTGFEKGVVVCGTGKVSRIISVFEGVLEQSQKSVSIDLVGREIAQMAAKIREDHLNSVGPIGRQAYETDNSVPEYSTAMATKLKNYVREEYVEKLHMSPTVLRPIVDVYSGAY